MDYGVSFGIIEMLLVSILCLGFGFQQLWSLRRDKLRLEREQRDAVNGDK